MKLGQIHSILTAQAKALSIAQCDCASARRASMSLLALAAAIEPLGSQTVGAFCAKVAKVEASTLGSAAAGVDSTDAVTSAAIAMLAEVVTAAGAKAAAKDLFEIAGSLAPFEGTSVVALVSAAYAPKSPSRSEPKSSRGQNAQAIVDPATLRALADRLTSASSDSSVFKSTLAEIKARKLSKAEVFAVSNMFLGREKTSSFNSIADAFKKIEERHFLDALSESRGRIINRINA